MVEIKSIKEFYNLKYKVNIKDQIPLLLISRVKLKENKL